MPIQLRYNIPLVIKGIRAMNRTKTLYIMIKVRLIMMKIYRKALANRANNAFHDKKSQFYYKT